MIKRMKKGVSPVIATVLLIMITIVAASLIVLYILPIIFGINSDCFDVVGDLTFQETKFNCYTPGSLSRTGFSIKVEGEKVVGANVALFSEGSSDAFEIKPDVLLEEIRMLTTDFNMSLELPSNGGVRTYVAFNRFTQIEISPVLSDGKICSVADTLILDFCDDQGVIGNLTLF